MKLLICVPNGLFLLFSFSSYTTPLSCYHFLCVLASSLAVPYPPWGQGAQMRLTKQHPDTNPARVSMHLLASPCVAAAVYPFLFSVCFLSFLPLSLLDPIII